MGKIFERMSPEHQAFIQAQQLFFTASAPREGRVNVSPKGLDTLRVLDERTAAYLDLTGSGNETAAHLADDGRLTFMFCSFSAKPRILRLYGQGRVVSRRDSDWPHLYGLFEPIPSARQIIVLDVESVQTSCGFGVPFLDFREDRPTLVDWAEAKGEKGLATYWKQRNQKTIDGLDTHLLEDRPAGG